jgi:hypothetical protein
LAPESVKFFYKFTTKALADFCGARSRIGGLHIYHYIWESQVIYTTIYLYSSLTRFLAEGPDFSCFTSDSSWAGHEFVNPFSGQ